MVVSVLHCKVYKNLPFLIFLQNKKNIAYKRALQVFYCFVPRVSFVFTIFDTEAKAEEYKNKHLL